MSKVRLTNKEEKKDVKMIIDLLSDYDHSRNTEVVKVKDSLIDSDFATDYGKRYLERIEQICSGNEQSRSCIICQKKYAKNRVVCNGCMDDFKGMTLNPVENFADAVDDMVGGDGFIGSGWKDIFTDLFKPHSGKDAEKIFIYGTEFTTPKEEKILSDWPKPWLYGRVFLTLLAAFVISYLIFLTGVALLAPTVLLLGSMLVPVPLLIMFYEINAPRNISIFDVTKIFILGGLLAIYITIILAIIGPEGNEMTYPVAFAVGIREELAKLIVVVYLLRKRKKNKKNYLLNGLLIGAAVGAGFAVFESAGYAQDAMLVFVENDQEVYIEMSGLNALFSIIVRGILSPGAHIAWAAISGFAAVLVGEKSAYRFKSFLNKRFIAIFLFPVLFHAIWDMPFDLIIGGLKQLFLLVLIWIMLIVFIDNGLDEINIINREKLLGETNQA